MTYKMAGMQADILCSFALVEFEEISVVTNAKVQYLFMDGHVVSVGKI